MKAVGKFAEQILKTLVEALKDVEDHKKVDNSGGAFMPVSVEFIGKCRLGDLFSVAHYYEQNGDLMRDPEMVTVENVLVLEPLTVVVPLKADIHQWMPGHTWFEEPVVIPRTLRRGETWVDLAIVGDDGCPRVWFALDARTADGWHPVARMDVTATRR